MDSNSPLSFIEGAGLAAFFLSLALIVVGFVVSAWLTSLFVRLVLFFMRSALNGEYDRMRGTRFRDIPPLENVSGGRH